MNTNKPGSHPSKIPSSKSPSLKPQIKQIQLFIKQQIFHLEPN